MIGSMDCRQATISGGRDAGSIDPVAESNWA